MKFEPKGPVKILQRQKDASTMTPDQTPKRPRDGRYNQSQSSNWATRYEGAKNGTQLGTGYNPEDKKYPKAMDMEKGMVLRKRKGQVRFKNQMVLRVKFIMLPKDQEKW